MLNIVATPIGNLADITLRAIQTLEESDQIICEDSRRASQLLRTYGIKKPLLILNDYNENRMLPSLITRLIEGKKLSLISDSGTPLISDPGFKLVKECLARNIAIDAIPGPSALIQALVLSGQPPDKFTFLGFLPKKSSHRLELLKNVRQSADILKTTFIVYEAPHKLLTTLTDMQQVFGDIEVTVERELTKVFQETTVQHLSSLINSYSQKSVKGEIVILFRLGSTNAKSF